MTDFDKSKEQLMEELVELRQRLEKSQAMFQATIESLPFEFFALGPDGRYFLQNSFSKIDWGDVIGKTPQQVCPNPEILRDWLENNRRAFAGERLEEDIRMTVGGKEKYYNNRVTPIRSGETIYGILGVNIDITDRKRAEQALQKSNDELEQRVAERTAELRESHEALRLSNETLQTIYDGILEGLLITDIETKRFVRANAAFCRMLGYSEEELLSASVRDIHPPEEVTDDLQRFEQVAQGQRFLNENRPVLRKDGSVFYADISGHLVVYEGRPCVLALFRDVTERRKAQVALKESEEKYKTLVETLPDAVIMADLAGHATFVSQRLLELHRAKSVDEFLGKTAWDFLVPEDHEKGREYYEKTLKEGIVRNAELSFFRMDGTRYPSELSSSLVKDDSGKPVAIINVLRDITERKQVEEALQQSERRFRSYFEQGLLGMAISDREMRWIEVNDRFCDIFGYSKEEVLQRKITDFVHHDDLDAFLQSYRQILSGGTDHYTVGRRYLRKDGKVVYLNIFVRVFRSADGTADHFLALLDDVTERKEAEEAIRQRNEELRTIQEEMADGIGIVSVENPRLLRANAAFCRMVGYSEEEFKLLPPSVVTPPELLPLIQQQLEIAKQKGIVRSSDFPFVRKDGSIFYADVAVSQMIYEGQPCWISVIHDITERKEAEETLRREHRTLKHLLQSSDHERQTIAYDIHDGLAQQLAGAVMQLDVYKSLVEKKPSDAAKAYEAAATLLQQAHAEARRLIAGIRHPVLDEAGVVEAVAHLINEQNRAKGPQIAFHSIVDFSRLVPLLENAIYRIIQEALNNACKYSQSDRVRITLLQQKDRLRIEIRDWGVGFNPKKVKEGSYGLTGIRERARLLGGKFRLNSAVGKGTRIVVELPLVEKEF